MRKQLLCTPSADASAAYLADLIRNESRFFFARIGDGAVECILDPRSGQTCDGEAYHPSLAAHMKDTIARLKAGGSGVLWGDWRSAIAGSAPKLVPEWEALVQPEDKSLLDYEAVLLMRQSIDLWAFYSVLQKDKRRKVYIGSAAHKEAPRLLDAAFLPLPMGGVYQHREMIRCYLETMRPELILFGAGMGGLIPIVQYWYANQTTTCIHLGSALDPLFYSRPTRSRQLSQVAAREFLKELL